MRFSSWPVHETRTACALIVMPRSRSRSIESSSCSRISRAETASVISRMRSASVDLPWSMWAMIEKLRILLWSMGSGRWYSGGLGSSPRRPVGPPQLVFDLAVPGSLDGVVPAEVKRADVPEAGLLEHAARCGVDGHRLGIDPLNAELAERL